MIVLKILLWLLLSVLVLLLLALLLPAELRVVVENGEVTCLKGRVLIFSVDILHLPKFLIPKKKKTSAPAEPKESVPKKNLLQRIQDLGIDFGVLPDLMAPSGLLLQKLFRSIRADNIELSLTASGRSPEAVGTNTGRMWAVLSPVLGVLSRVFRLTFERVEVVPDFAGDRGGRSFMAADFFASPFALGSAVLFYFIKFKSITDKKDSPQPTNNEEGKR